MFLEFKKEVEHVLRDALEKASYDYKDLALELEESEYADVTSRVAFPLARLCHKPPAIIAEDIVNHIEIPAARDTLIADAVAAGPYINLSVNDLFLHKTLHEIKGGIVSLKNRGKIIIEHTSANPDGPLHIGHLRTE